MAKKKQGRKPGGTWLSPGVHVEEVSSGPRPIGVVGTAVAGFVGLAQRHPAQAAVGVVAMVLVVAVIVRAVRD
jgi:phage tail sheath protein FI